MKKIFDLVDAINEKVMAFFRESGHKPSQIAISRDAYRRLVVIRSEECKIGNLVIGCSPITEIETQVGNICVEIDEILSETEFVVS